jgi:hypothetical protein
MLLSPAFGLVIDAKGPSASVLHIVLAFGFFLQAFCFVLFKV